MNDRRAAELPTLMGHPTGLFNLFFAEMWERFSYYGMRALLVLYMVKGFMGLNDHEAYAVYGAYTALVYMTPFFGGMLADRLLGQRRAVLLGGILMAAGHGVMTFEDRSLFFLALGLLIVGNGFFKPNISTMVGALYAKGSPKREGGFTLFYMGINLGAALSPLLCGYVGETVSWHAGFGLATIGMLVGLATFWAPTALSQMLILTTAVLTAVSMVWTQIGTHPVPMALYIVMAVALIASAVVAFVALGRGGIPDEVGQPKDPAALKRPVLGIPAEYAVYIGSLLVVPVLALLVSGALAEPWIPRLGDTGTPAGLVLALAGIGALGYLLAEMGRLERIAREKMTVALILIFFSMLFWAFFEQAGSSINNFTDRNVDRVLEDRRVESADEGKQEVVVLTQEQLGYSIPAIAGVHAAISDRVATMLVAAKEGTLEASVGELKEESLHFKLKPSDLLGAAGNESVAIDAFSWLWAKKIAKGEEEVITRASHDADQPIVIDLPNRITQAEFWKKTPKEQADELLGSPKFTLEKLDAARNRAKDRATLAQQAVPDLDVVKLPIAFTSDHLGMGVATTSKQEIPASTFQSVNAIFIILFGLVFTAMWAWFSARGREPSTPFKFALGLLQLGLGFLALYWGAQTADSRGMVAVGWLVLGYLMHTTGELCLSPVGLSMITRLSPAKLVSTMMGMWFLATAFSNFLASIIAKTTGVEDSGGGGKTMPVPSETLHTYGNVFQTIGYVAMGCAVVCFLLVPLMKKWMHDEAGGTAGH